MGIRTPGFFHISCCAHSTPRRKNERGSHSITHLLNGVGDEDKQIRWQVAPAPEASTRHRGLQRTCVTRVGVNGLPHSRHTPVSLPMHRRQLETSASHSEASGTRGLRKTSCEGRRLPSCARDKVTVCHRDAGSAQSFLTEGPAFQGISVAAGVGAQSGYPVPTDALGKGKTHERLICHHLSGHLLNSG